MQVPYNYPQQPAMPSKDIPDNEKDEMYVLKTAIAFHRTWCGYPMTDLYGAATIMSSPLWAQFNRALSRGLDTGDNLRKAHQLNDTKANDAMTAMLIPWDPSMFQVKPMNLIRHFLEQRATSIVAWPEDPYSVGKSEFDRFMRMARMKMAKDNTLQTLSKGMGVDMSIPDGEPQDEMELDLYEQSGPKTVEAATITNAINLLHNLNNYNSVIRKRMAWELIDTGISAVGVRPTPSGIPEAVSIPVEDLILEFNRDGIFDDMQIAAWIDWRTPAEVYQEMGAEAVQGDLAQLQDMVKQLASDGRIIPLAGNQQGYRYRKPGRVPVMRFYFKDINHLEVSERESRSGGTIYRQGAPKNRNWKSSKKPYEVVYAGNWVIGSPHPDAEKESREPGHRCLYWKVGLMEDIPRNGTTKDGYNPSSPDGGYKAWLPIVVRGHNMTNMATLSIAEMARVKMYEINMLVIKLRNNIQSIIPPGLGEINVEAIISAMTDLDMPSADKVPFALKMFRQTGGIPSSKKPVIDDQGAVSVPPPMTPHEGFIGDLERIINAIESFKSWLHEALGVNDATLGNTTDSKQLVGSLKIQAQGTAAALGTLFDCFDSLERDVALLEYRTLRCALRKGYVLKGAVDSLFGHPASKWLEFSEKDDPGCIGIKVEKRITDEDKMQLQEACLRYMERGELTPGDVLAVMQMSNYALAIALMDNRVKKNKEQAHRMQLEIQQSAQQGQAQAAQVVAESKARDMKTKTQADMQIQQGKSAAQLQVEQMKAENAQLLEQLRTNTQVMIEQSRQQHEMMMLLRTLASKEKIAEEQEETKEEIAGMKEAEAGGED